MLQIILYQEQHLMMFYSAFPVMIPWTEIMETTSSMVVRVTITSAVVTAPTPIALAKAPVRTPLIMRPIMTLMPWISSRWLNWMPLMSLCAVPGTTWWFMSTALTTLCGCQPILTVTVFLITAMPSIASVSPMVPLFLFQKSKLPSFQLPLKMTLLSAMNPTIPSPGSKVMIICMVMGGMITWMVVWGMTLSTAILVTTYSRAAMDSIRWMVETGMTCYMARMAVTR